MSCRILLNTESQDEERKNILNIFREIEYFIIFQTVTFYLPITW